MRIAVLASPGSWYFKDLVRAAADEGHEITAVRFTQLASFVGEGGEAIDDQDRTLGGNEAVMVRTMPPGSLEQVVFRMDILQQLAKSGLPVVNSARAIEVAVDKYLATSKLREAGLRVPQTVTCQTADEAMRAFVELGRDVVVKPLFGGEGRGITRVTDDELAWRAFKMLEQIQSVIYLQEYIPHHGSDIRLLVVGKTNLAVRRLNERDWRTNVSRGARTTPVEVTRELADMARRAVDAVGAEIAGVDVLPAKDGLNYVLEVNAVPGWRALSRTLRTDVARLMLTHVSHLATS